MRRKGDASAKIEIEVSIPMTKPTQIEIAAALGVTARRVNDLKRAGMPVDSIEAALAWRAEREGGDSSAEALRRERIALTRTQRERAAFELEKERGQWISRGAVDQRDIAIGAAVRAALLKLASDLPPMLEGLPAAKIAKVLRETHRGILEQLADDQSEFWK